MSRSQKHTYNFNPHTLKYEKVKLSFRERVGKVSVNILFGILIGIVIGVAIMFAYQSPKDREMHNEVAKYNRIAHALDDRIDMAERVLLDLEERDDNLYRVILESEPVSHQPKYLLSASNDDEIDISHESLKRTTERIDNLYQRLYIESKSMDTLFEMTKENSKRLAAIPAIMPIDKSRCRVVSGFGIRFHPILRYNKLHTGIDFSAHKNTPIYATGDGEVRVSGHNVKGYSGYGTVVVIDHGYGFQTLYAHMGGTKVKVGQKVKRGQQIGFVGSTGLSSGPHLHYEVIFQKKKVDPVYYFFSDLTPEEYEEVLELAREENQSMS